MSVRILAERAVDKYVQAAAVKTMSLAQWFLMSFPIVLVV